MVIKSKSMKKRQISSRGYNDIKESDTGSASSMFDVITQTWTQPIPNYLIEHYLKRMVYVCSCCIFQSGSSSDVANHFSIMKNNNINHKSAKIKDAQSDRGGFIYVCTGCPVKSTTRQKAEKHISNMLSQVHVNPTVLDLKQFSLEPRPSHLSEVEDHNSVDSTPFDRPRRRKRNRGRKR